MTLKTDLSSLNENQRLAVVSEDARILVLAGAGSGKTKTLIQKIIYLIEEKGVSPSQILAITFTKNAANEMLDRMIFSADQTETYKNIVFDKDLSNKEKDKQRIVWQHKFKWIEGLAMKTFHSFCYGVLRTHGVNEFDNRFKIINEDKSEGEDISSRIAPETIYEVMSKLLIEKCNDTSYLLSLKRYVLDYLVDQVHLDVFTKKLNSYKEGKYFTTLDGTKVRSKSEQFIADWFYRHNIKYEYEPVLNVKDFDFTPDFYIPDANMYIEHISDKSFPMKNKEEQFEKGNLLYVKTYDSMTLDSSLFNHTLDKIVKGRLPHNYIENRNLNYREEFNSYFDKIKEFIRQVIRIMGMIKVENIDLQVVASKSKEDKHERVRVFYELALPLINEYLHYCTNKSYLDFNDLISTCTSLFKNQEDITHRYKETYKYILIDEFQDVNNLQVELVKLLLTDETQLFCVGDDWQSIYGFRGSNVSYIIEFEKHFPNSKLIKLNLNYRSSDNIVGASNEVIKHNKFKVEKDVYASKRSEHKIVIYAGNTIEENIQFCIDKVRELQTEEDYGPDDILFLYKRNKMFSNSYEIEKSLYHQLRNEGLKVQSKTIHSAKGLEAKVVFILGMTEGSGGFPDIWLEDRIFQVVKKANHDLLLEEERRLFYVAITRAKDKLFLITEKGSESNFLKEIPDIFTVKSSIAMHSVVEAIETCPKCYSQLEKLWKVCPYCGEKILDRV